MPRGIYERTKEHRIKMSKAAVKRYKNPDEIEKTRKRTTENWQIPEIRIKRSDAIKEAKNTPEAKEKQRVTMNRPEVKEKISKALNRPEVQIKLRKPKSEEAKANMKGHSGVYVRTLEMKRNMRKVHIGTKGQKFSKELYPNFGMRRKKHTKETGKKISIASSIAFEKRVESSKYPRNYMMPNFNFESILIFKALDKVLHTRSRYGGTKAGEKKVGRYFVDCFNKKYKFIIEWNEDDHNYYPEGYDIKKREYILVRYSDYNYIIIRQSDWFEKGNLTEEITTKIVNHIVSQLYFNNEFFSKNLI
ncbi:hypothetical protein ES705_39277 [subsurface metagenome]